MHVKIEVVLVGTELREPSSQHAPSDVLAQLQIRQAIAAALETRLAMAEGDINWCRKCLKNAVDNEQAIKRLIEEELGQLQKPAPKATFFIDPKNVKP